MEKFGSGMNNPGSATLQQSMYFDSARAGGEPEPRGGHGQVQRQRQDPLRQLGQHWHRLPARQSGLHHQRGRYQLFHSPNSTVICVPYLRFNPYQDGQGRKGPCFFQRLYALKCQKIQKIPISSLGSFLSNEPNFSRRNKLFSMILSF